ncbi:MAG: hypothetical protein M1409_08130 [Actinobacteria bacterium]|nr:hypothetical protein [Actinomycetota bacterium]
MENKNIPIGVRISEKVKLKFDKYCDTHGMKKSFLLNNLIEEKIVELEEDEEDLKIALSRLEDETLGIAELNDYFKKRGV